MSDPIDRNELIKAAERKQFAIADNTHPYEAIRIQGRYFREVVDNAPTVDAVPVVRCKDCKYFDDGECNKLSEPEEQRQYERWIVYVDENEYCSNGEMRTDGAKMDLEVE